MADPKPALDPIIRKVFQQDAEYLAFGEQAPARELPDYIFATDDQEQNPAAIFRQIRWGGQYVFASSSIQKVAKLSRDFAEYGFAVERPAGTVLDGWRFWPVVRKKAQYFAARKVLHVPKGEVTNRFTFEVQLNVSKEKHNGHHVVTKRIPSTEWVLNRLRQHAQGVEEEELVRRAQSLIRNILPIFLTREVSIMNRLQERLPVHLRSRVPHTLHYEQDDRGLVKLLQVNWLRNGGSPISQLDFAEQSAELLRCVHEKAGVIHLDLRLDNIVVTPEGVGFIDFGNSVHDDEDIAGSPILSKVFSDLMRTTQVQRTLERYVQQGHVTAPYFTNAVFKVDKAVDLFFLVLQFTAPHENPDLKDFIAYTKNSKEDYELHKMTNRLFSPEDLEPGKVYTAAHVANAVRIIRKRIEA